MSEPEHSDAVIQANTGRGWDEWCALIKAWPDHDRGHGAVASWLQTEHKVDGWWAQAVTVGWERITGRRQLHQIGDGTFTANRTATVTADPAALRERLIDDDARAVLFPGLETQLRSRPTSKNVRFGLPAGVAEIAFAPKDDGRLTVSVQHAKLASPDEVQHWKAFWGDWLGGLDGA